MRVGHVDSIERSAAAGWAADTDRPNERSVVVIEVNGREHGRVTADKLRDGLRQSGIYGDGLHGFEYVFEPPLSVFSGHDVTLRFADTGVTLPHGRRRILPLRRRSLCANPILVTATGRSGTTLLMNRLGNDQRIVIANIYPYETLLLTYYARVFEFLSSPGDRKRSIGPEEIFANPYFLGRNPFNHPSNSAIYPSNNMLPRFFEINASRHLSGAFSAIATDFYTDLAFHQGKPGVQFFAEKSDIFRPTRDFAKLAFEHVKEIVLLRDPRDVHLSRQSFWSDTPEKSFQNLRDVQAKLLRIREESSPTSAIHFVRYEDLVKHSDDTMKDIANFLGFDTTIEINSDGERQIFSGHSTSRDPAASIGRWRTEMDAEGRAIFEREFRPFFQAFGYELST